MANFIFYLKFYVRPSAIELKQLIRDARDEIDSLNIEFKKFRIDFTKLRRTSLDELQSTCSNNNGGDDIIGNICEKVENLLNSIDQTLPISDLVTAEVGFFDLIRID
ncbi:unnamed protein product [Anisakis simplex]|uniref:DUF503 domain-containing protein n=1 Tax=Anisakis simplex TaxID=6269 RepID=A0A0M3JEJ3_ANISI|nr:unnamed protein product [Anisakis simplex]